MTCIGLIQFSQKKKDERGSLAGDAATLGKSYLTVNLAQRAFRRGIPMMAGVRLESHSTGNKNAKEILKNGGILDPNRMGQKTDKLMGGSGPDNIYGGKKYSFITGNLEGNFTDRSGAGSLRKAYRVSGSSDPSDLLLVQKENIFKNLNNTRKQADPEVLRRQINSVYGLNLETLDEVDLPKNQSFIRDQLLAEKSKRNAAKLRIAPKQFASSVFGRSLYVGGSDAFYKANFTPDADMPLLAMKTDKPLKVYGNRLSATVGAVKREGLGNLMKANKARVAKGVALTGLGLVAAKETVSGLKKVFIKGHIRDNGTKVKSFWRKNN